MIKHDPEPEARDAKGWNRLSEKIVLEEERALELTGTNPMKLYRFLTGPDDATFCHKVTAALNKGWHLFGSPTYAYDKKAKAMRCGQAVVKDVDGQQYGPDTKLSDW